MTLSLGSIFSFWKSADATRGQQFTWIFIQKRVLGLFFFDSVKQFIFHHLSHDSVQNLGGDFARVFGGLAQFVLNFFVTGTFSVDCVTASWHVVVPWFQFFSKIANLAWKMIKLYKNFVTKAKKRSKALTCCIFCVGDQRGGTKSVDPIVVPQTEKDKNTFSTGFW